MNKSLLDTIREMNARQKPRKPWHRHARPATRVEPILTGDTILSVDPSSSAIGWAAMDYRGMLLRSGVLGGKRSEDANARIESMTHRLFGVASEVSPTVIVIEDTTGAVGRRHGGAGAGLAVYGKAIGYVTATLKTNFPSARVVLVPENEWTRGKCKADRTKTIAMMFTGQYDMARDPGGDEADAIGLGWWYFCLARSARTA